MVAKTQYKMTSSDLEIVLAVVRAGTLNEAGKRLGVDGSTIFRSVKRIEKGLGERLFSRSRQGSQPTELAHQLAQHAERIEVELDSAIAATRQDQNGLISGTVKVATTDTILQSLILPALADISVIQPYLRFDISTSNEFTSLSMHDADIALRVTRAPPEHLIGRHLGQIRMAMFGPLQSTMPNYSTSNLALCNWVAPDDYLPHHPSVSWRKRAYPSVIPHYKVNSIMSVAAAIAAGIGVGMIPLYLAKGNSEIVQISDPIEECETQLWLLIRTESRHITSVSTVYNQLANRLRLE